MPLIHTFEIANAAAHIWHITEKSAFFLEKIGDVANIQEHVKHIKNTTKQNEFLASRYLIFLKGDANYLQQLHKTANGKPFILNSAEQISISHTQNYAALLSSNKNCGIDIEMIHDRVHKIAQRFLHENEWQFINSEYETALLTLFWSAKETIYKWYGKGNLTFNTQIILQSLEQTEDAYENGILHYQFTIENEVKYLPVYFQKFNNHYLTALTM